MLIVCPNCATSYKVDPQSLGDGRTVRCARCKTSWFAGGANAAARRTTTQASGFVDDVIAEAEARSGAEPAPRRPMPAPQRPQPFQGSPADADDFGAESGAPMARSATRRPNDGPPADGLSDSIEQQAIPAAEAPSLVPPIDVDPPPEPGSPDHHAADIESFSERRARLQSKRKTRRRSSKWTAIILVLFGFNVALIGARNEVVRFLPQTASLFAAIGLPVNLRHLTFDDVRITKEENDGVAVLVVEGTIVSTNNQPTEVPRLRFSVRNATGQEIYTWTALPTRSILDPGARLPFRSRLAAPPADASDVMVRFFTARDATAGAK